MKLTKRPNFRADPDKKQRSQRRKLWREYLTCAQAGGWREAARRRRVSVLYFYDFVVHAKIPARREDRVALGLEPGDLADWVKIARDWLGERDPGVRFWDREKPRVYGRGGRKA